MKIKYNATCTEWDSQLVKILLAGREATMNEEKREKYSHAIELIADTYLERMNEKVEKVFEVNIIRKSTVMVSAKDENEASTKAAGVDNRDSETVTTEVK